MKKKIFASAGEVSGDKILSLVLKQFKGLESSVEVNGIFGSQCEKLGYQSMVQMEQTAVNGIKDVLMKLPTWISIYRNVLKLLNSRNFSLVILVDFPGFNNRLLKYCKKKSVPVFFIAPPQVWPYRKRNLSRYHNVNVQPLFEIDREAYLKAGARVSVGHFFREEKQKRLQQKNLMGIFPGSRRGVLQRNLPEMIHAVLKADGIRNRFPLRTIFVPAFLEPEAEKIITTLGPAGDSFKINTDFQESGINPGFAIASPGTITLELALRNIPTLIFCVLDALTHRIGRRMLKTPWLALPSGLLNQAVFPEVVGTASQLGAINLDTLSLSFADPPVNNLFKCLGDPQGPEIAFNNCLRLMKMRPDKGNTAPKTRAPSIHIKPLATGG